MAADFVFFLLALAGVVTVVERIPQLRAGMVIAGGILMLYFAVGAAESIQETLAPGDDVTAGNGFSKAFVLALTNPYQILFWLTVGVGLLDPGRVDVLSYVPVFGEQLGGLFIVQTGSIALLAGLFGGIGIWVVGFPATLVAARNRVETLAPLVAGVSAVVLAGFGFFFLWNGATILL